MKVILEQEAIAQIESLLNELPIKVFGTAQAIIKVLTDNKVNEKPDTAIDSDNS